MAKRKTPEQLPGWTAESEREKRSRRVADNPTLLEITQLAVGEKSIEFVRKLAECFTAAEVVLILRAAKSTKLI